MLPSQIKTGEAIQTKWGNDVVTSLRELQYTNIPNNRIPVRIYKPFDPIMLEARAEGLSGADINWYIKLKEAVYYEKHKTDYTQIYWNATSLLDRPEIKMERYKDLYFNYKTKKLQWDDPTAIANLKVLKVVYDGDDFEIKNVHPKHVDLRLYPPFTTLFSSNSDFEYSVALTHGYVSETIPLSGVASGLKQWLPENLITAGELIHHDITTYQQIGIQFETSVKGQILDTTIGRPKVVIESTDTPTIHWNSTITGDFHYPIANLIGTGLTQKLAGSDIYYTNTYSSLSTTSLSALSGENCNITVFWSEVTITPPGGTPSSGYAIIFNVRDGRLVGINGAFDDAVTEVVITEQF